jgi:uncharacterized protein
MSQLIIFLGIYFAVYGAVHLYVLIKLRRAFYLHGLRYGFLALLFLFFMLSPIQSRIFESQGFEIASILSAWIGFVWMGFLFLFICFSLPLDGYQLLISFGQRITGGDWIHLMLSRRQYVAVAGILAGCLAIYGGFEASRIRVEKVTIETTKIPLSQGRVRIVQLSDVHIGPVRYPGRLAAMVAAVKAAQPDILVSTGDLVESRIHDASTIAPMLRALSAPLGKFAVTGNHEFYGDIDQAVAFTQAAGFTLLRNRSLAVGKTLTVVGVDDPAGGSSPTTPTEGELLAQTPAQGFTLLLKHRPNIDPASRERFDLQLSGHTHKGQIFPFTLLIQLRYPLYTGLYRFKTGGSLYVSRGTGTWGPPMRLLAPPEITIIDLVAVQSPPKAGG